MSINDLTDPNAINRALKEYDELGGTVFLKRYGFEEAERYFISHNGRLYDAKAVASVAHGFQNPALSPLKNGDFRGGVTGANLPLERAGFTIVDGRPESVEDERRWRELVYAHLKSLADPAGLNVPADLQFIGAFRSMRGIWVDKKRTQAVHPAGVTVSLKHTGRHYADEVTNEGMTYYYPTTNSKGQDLSEVTATKAAAEVEIPLFAILDRGSRREVRLGWVEGWDDPSKRFYITFQADPPQKILDHDRSEEEKFRLDGNRSHRRAGTTRVRPDQARFRFQLVQRYGERCPFTGLTVPVMLEAAHLKPDSVGGTSDPRNGLLMSVALHRAFDAYLFAVNPDTLEVETRPGGPGIEDLHIVHTRLDMQDKPHHDALSWRYEAWKKSWQS